MSDSATVQSGKWKKVGVRFGSAMALVFICLVPFYFGGWIWAALVSIFGVRMIYEWVRMSHPKPKWTTFAAPIFGLLAGVIYVVQGYFGLSAVAVLVTLLSVAGLQLVQATPNRNSRLIWAAMGAAYIVIPCLMIIALRGNFVGFGTTGFQRLIFIFFCVAAADVGAYFGGSFLGGPKLAPKISPNKTWSGFLSGQIFAVIIGALVGAWAGIGWINGAFLALPIAVLSVLGDLFESGVKRKLGVKDTGTVMPGHGGLLDRLDSLMAAVLGATIMLTLFPNIWPG